MSDIAWFEHLGHVLCGTAWDIGRLEAERDRLREVLALSDVQFGNWSQPTWRGILVYGSCPCCEAEGPGPHYRKCPIGEVLR